MSACRRASLQSAVEIVYSSDLLSGLGEGDPACRMSCMSRNVIGRPASCASAGVARLTAEAASRIARYFCIDFTSVLRVKTKPLLPQLPLLGFARRHRDGALAMIQPPA